MRLFNLFVYFIVVMLYAGDLWAHGTKGKRFFPASLAVDDPFPSDELTLLAPSYSKGHDDKELSFGFGIQRRISLNTALSIEGEYLSINPNEGPNEKRFANPEITLTYAMFRSPEHEFIASTALGFKPGITTDEGTDDQSIHTAFLFGKGLGDLPDRLSYFRPFAFTGSIGLAMPIGERNPSVNNGDTGMLEYGLVMEYSIPYLQSFVKDIGIPRPFRKMFPIIEITYQHPIGGQDAEKGTGSFNPGIIWAGKYVELGIEAKIPLNDEAADGVGVAGLIHLFLDDILERR